MGRNVDLDVLAAQRAEARGEPPTLTFKGETFTLPVEMPIAVVEAWAADADAVDFGKAILGDEWERFRALNPTRDDIWALGANVQRLWSVTQGESEASGDSSSTDGTTSRPTSSGSTDSTSAERSGVLTPSVPAASAS